MFFFPPMKFVIMIFTARAQDSLTKTEWINKDTATQLTF